MAHEPTCQHCAAALQHGTYFCSECGKAVPAATDQKAPKGTMLGGAALVPPSAPAAPDDIGRTTAAGLSQPPRGQMGRTMLGIPLSPVPPAPDAAPQAAAPAPAPASSSGAKRSMARTMLGLPAAGTPQASNSGAAAATARPERSAGADPRHARTLAGAPDALADTELARRPAQEPQGAHASQAHPADAKRTMLGLGDDAAPVDERPARGSAPRDSKQPDARSSDPRTSRPSGAAGRASAHSSWSGVRRGPSKPVLAFAVTALLAAAVLGYMALRPAAGPGVRVRVVSDGENESMQFEVPGATAGAKLRFGGQEKALEAGRISFPLAPDSLQVGKNVVPYDLVEANGEITSGRIGLQVDYRVTLDTAPLRAGKPRVDVVVSALPGSEVWLDGQQVELDAKGRAVRTDALEPGGASDRIEHIVRYRVQPPSAETSVGELRTSIPVTGMAIDKPGMQVTTDRDSVEIAGAVDKDASVTIDGQQVSVNEGRFLHGYPLPEPGEYEPEIVASSDGKAPRALKLSVTRVRDLAEAARDFAPDGALTYAKIAQNPAIYRGQRVAFEGRVYNVNVEGGRSALQMLVRECAAGQRCPLWVGYHAATDYTVDSWVRVLGVIEGEQQFRSETDEIKAVPKVEATFLLPAEP